VIRLPTKYLVRVGCQTDSSFVHTPVASVNCHCVASGCYQAALAASSAALVPGTRTSRSAPPSLGLVTHLARVSPSVTTFATTPPNHAA